jgi:hypothetical protein
MEKEVRKILRRRLTLMNYRCNSDKDYLYKIYKGKGIKVFKEWLDDPDKFVKWSINNGYREGLTIDRIDGDLGYHPDNCRWVGADVQSRNRKSYKKGIKYIGVTKRKGSEAYNAKVLRCGELIYISRHNTQEEAAMARDKFLIDNNLEGEYSLNMPNYDYSNYEPTKYISKLINRYKLDAPVYNDNNSNKFRCKFYCKGKSISTKAYLNPDEARQERIDTILKLNPNAIFY